jgi:predicted Zn-dependent peptidase
MTGACSRGPATLPNGIPFQVLHRQGAEVTTVSVWILAGSRHESVPGVTHLFEHVVMQAIPAGRDMRVVDEIESWGGDANAMTTRDYVMLYARVPTSDAGAALGVLSAAATTAKFDSDVVDGERRVVHEELRMAAADPTDIVHDAFFSAAYGDHPMGRPVGGTAEQATRVHADDLRAWSAAHVRPGQLAVVVSGGMTADEVGKLLADGELGALAGPATGRPPEDTPVLRAGRKDLPLASDTAAIVVGGQGFALSDPRLAAAQIVVELLANGNGSVLNEEIRSRRGLSYDVSGGASGYRDTGSWRVSITTAPAHRDEVADLAVELIDRAVRRGWSPAEVAVARRRAAGLAQLATESSLEEALDYGDHAFVGDAPGWSLQEFLRRLAAIDADEINETARTMAGRLVVATAGGDQASPVGGREPARKEAANEP